MSLRLKYALLSLLFLASAFFTKFYSGPYWRFADAYLGDVFIVACLYFALSIVCESRGALFKFAAIAALAIVVELFQATGIPASLNLPKPFVFILGTSFDPKDFLFYFAGLCLAVVIDFLVVKREK